MQEPISATVKEIVTRLLATTGVLIKYSRGEEIRNTNRAQMRIIATRKWRRTGLIEITVIVVFGGATGCAYSPAGAFLIYLSFFLGSGCWWLRCLWLVSLPSWHWGGSVGCG